MKKIAKVLQIYFVLQLDLQNSLGCAGTKPRQSITRSSKIISNNLENATEQLVEETNKFKAFQIRYNKSYSDAKEVSVLWFLHVLLFTKLNVTYIIYLSNISNIFLICRKNTVSRYFVTTLITLTNITRKHTKENIVLR